MKGEIKMDTMKRFFRYTIFLILFWILSDFLIKVGINSMYKNIEKRQEIPALGAMAQKQAH